MARVYLHTELIPLLKTCKAMLDNSIALLNRAETAVDTAVKAGESPENVNAIGDEGYAAAGKVIAQTMDILQRLGATKAAGLRFPRICKIGSPLNFTRAFVDSANITGNKSFVTAVNLHDDADTTQNPFDFLTYSKASPLDWTNVKVKIMKSLVINWDTNKKTFDAKDAIMTIDTRDVDGGGKARLLFADVFQYGTAKTHPTDAGTDTQSFELRTVDDGENASPDEEELSVQLMDPEIASDTPGTYLSSYFTGDILAILYTAAESDPYFNGWDLNVETASGETIMNETGITTSMFWFLEKPFPIVDNCIALDIDDAYSAPPNKHGHFAIIYRSRKKSL